MAYRVLTVSREFGSGGGRIAGLVAEKLGWKLLDRALIEAIAGAARVDAAVVSRYDEHVERWLSRVNRRAMRGAALSAGVIPEESECFDHETMVSLSRRIIEDAAQEGSCVIVGRGAQCILQKRTDTFHVSIYAPLQERVRRLKTRLEPGVNIAERVRLVDDERARYLRTHFDREWKDPHLYNLMVSSLDDEEATARVILHAMLSD